MPAYGVLEDCENSGGIVFAKTSRQARRLGANEFNGGDQDGVIVTRMKELDRFEHSDTGVPARLLVESGWRFECDGCGMTVSAKNLEDEGLSVSGVVGFEGFEVYCCHACRMKSKAEEAAREAFGEAFLDMLCDLVCERFGDVKFGGEVYKRRYSVLPGRHPMVVQDATVHFEFPGMKIAPARMQYRHAGVNGQPLIGPVRPEITCSAGDRDAFEAFAARTALKAQAHG